MSSALNFTAQLTPVRGNVALLLADADRAWRVHRGTVGVFAVRVEGGTPVGPRRYLFSCSAGDWLFGAEPNDTVANRGFLVVGLEDSELEAVSLHSLANSANGTLPEIVASVEAWVRRIGSVIGGRTSHAHAEKARSDGPIALAAGQCIKPQSESVLWLNVRTGRMALADTDHHSVNITAEMPWTPVSGDIRLCVLTDAEVEFRPSADIVATPNLGSGLQQLHRLCFAHLEHLDQQQRDQDARRLAERRELQAAETSIAFGELGQALVNRRTAAARDDDLMTALAAIGDVLGVTFRRPPAHAGNAGRAEDTIESIARASRVRARNVLLRGDWWKQDAGPILGRLGEEGRPVALLPANRGYVMFNPASGARDHVGRAQDQQLSPDATTFIRPLPEAANSLVELTKFAIRPIATDLALVIFLVATITVLGMWVPIATGLIFDEAIPDADVGLLYQLAAGLFAMTLAQAALSYSQWTILLRTDTSTTARLQSAVIDRLLRIPARFFRTFSSGDLQNRAMMITEISRDISNTAVGGILTGGMAALNLFMCLYYNPKLTILAVVSAAIIAAYTFGLSLSIRGAARNLASGRENYLDSRCN